MQGKRPVLDLLNELLTLELTAINQYVVHQKLCESWGYDRLAERIRKQAMDEMRDAEAIIDRIIFLEGLPNVQRIGPVVVGESPHEQLRLMLETERAVHGALERGVALCVEQGDPATREFVAERLPEEEAHIDWLETQLSLIERLGEANYLAQQLRG